MARRRCPARAGKTQPELDLIDALDVPACLIYRTRGTTPHGPCEDCVPTRLRRLADGQAVDPERVDGVSYRRTIVTVHLRGGGQVSTQIITEPEDPHAAVDKVLGDLGLLGAG